MNIVLYKIFGAMSKDSYGEICEYFGIDKVEELTRHLLIDTLHTSISNPLSLDIR